MYAEQRGIPALAVTFVSDSRLATAARMKLSWTYEDPGFGPGTISYLGSIVSLLAVALLLGRMVGTLDDDAVEATLDAIRTAGDAVQTAVDDGWAAAESLAAAIDERRPLVIIGGGPNYATALFGMAKFIESARHNAVGQELEEWAHEQYFCTGPGTVTIAIAPAGRGVDRAREQLRAVRDVAGTGAVICTADDVESAGIADYVLPIGAVGDELLSPLVTAVPLEMVALAFARRLGRTMLGFDDENRREVNFRQIFDSAIPGAVR